MTPRRSFRSAARRCCTVSALAGGMIAALACQKAAPTTPSQTTPEAVAKVTVAAEPASVPFSGGTSAISALVVDASGNPVAATRVSFAVSTGSLTPTVVKSDSKGVAKTTLTTATAATVTATAGPAVGANGQTVGGTATGTATVGVTARPKPVVTVTPGPNPIVGRPVTFSITAAPGEGSDAAVTSVVVDFGDLSSPVDLGAGSDTKLTQHTYSSAGTYIVTATATDASRISASASATVTVAVKPQPTVTLEMSANPKVGTPVTFTIVVKPADGTAIASVIVDFGDGTAPAYLGAVSGTILAQHLYAGAGTYTVAITAIDTAGGTGRAAAIVVITAAP